MGEPIDRRAEMRNSLWLQRRITNHPEERYAVGDLVMIKADENKRPKNKPRNYGPFQVIEVHGKRIISVRYSDGITGRISARDSSKFDGRTKLTTFEEDAIDRVSNVFDRNSSMEFVTRKKICPEAAAKATQVAGALKRRGEKGHSLNYLDCDGLNMEQLS